MKRNVQRGPSHGQLVWMSLLCKLHFMPKAIVIVDDVSRPGHTLELTYRVQCRYSMHSRQTQCFYGILTKVVANSDGDVLFDGQGRPWIHTVCDKVAIDLTTQTGVVEFDSANRFI